jgi:HEAT repeat protein
MAPNTSWIAGWLVVVSATVAYAHGGAYQPPPPPMPPAGAVPPGLRLGGPTTPGGDPGPGPTTGGGGTTGGPTTGGKDVGGGPGKGGPTTGGGSSPAPGGGPTTGGGTFGNGPATGGAGPTRPAPKRFSGAGIGQDHWTRWWYPNRRHIMRWNARVAERAVLDTTPSGTAAQKDDGLWRAEVQAALHGALHSSNEDLASGAAVALGKLGDPSDAPALSRVLFDESRQQPVREAAALALGLLPAIDAASGDARQALAKVASDGGEPERLRAVAVYALGLRGEPASVPLLIQEAHASGATWDVPAAAVAALGLVGVDLVHPDLIELLEGPRRKKQQEAVRRAYAAQALANLAADGTLDALREAAQDSDENVRRAAILALGASADATDDATMDTLARVIHRDKDAPCRHVAAIALGRIGHSRGEAALRHAYLKGDSLLQPFAALGLGLYARHDGKERAADVVLKDLETRANAELRGALAIAVGLSGNRAGAEILRDLAGSRGDPALRGHAAIALGLLDDRSEGAPILRKLLTEVHDPGVQREVALALGMLGDREATRLLVRLVEDGDTVYVQGSAAMALGRIGGAEAGKALLGLLQDDSRPDLARAMAAVGLGMILDASEGKRLATIGADLNWYLFTPTVHEILTIL